MGQMLLIQFSVFSLCGFLSFLMQLISKFLSMCKLQVLLCGRYFASLPTWVWIRYQQCEQWGSNVMFSSIARNVESREGTVSRESQSLL